MLKASEASRIGKRSRRKGSRLEKEVARIFGGQRVPLSGALDGQSLSNDVVLPNGWRAEVKGRRHGFGLLYKWLDDSWDLFFFREPGRPWLVLMDQAHFNLLEHLAAQDPVWPEVLGLARIPPTWMAGLKERKGGLETIYRWIEDQRERPDLLFLRRDLSEWLVVMLLGHFATLCPGGMEPRAKAEEGTAQALLEQTV